MTYAIYLRKSRKDLDLEALGQGETLARHKAALLELAQKQGLNISKIYEEVVSGELIAARPQMQELLDDVYAGKYKGVLVMEVERLARGNTKDQGEVAEAFSMTGTFIVTPAKTYDPNDEFDEEYFEFGLFMSRREYKTIRRRMERGRLAAVKEGNYVGSLPPYGYDIVRLNKKERTLKLNDQSKYVEMIYNWFVKDRLNPGEITRRLTAMGIPTRTGKAEWNRGTVKEILKNILYTGKIVWNKRKTSREFEEGKVIKKKRRLTPDDMIIVPGKHQAIISEELYNEAQKLFTGSVPVKAMTRITNPFAGIMCCKHCGKNMRYQSYAHKRGTVQARMVHPESAICKVKSATYTEVIEAVSGALKLHINDFEFKLETNNEESEKAATAEILASLHKELTKLQKRREGLFELLEDGTYTREEFNERKGVLAEKIEKIQAAIHDEESKEIAVIDYQDKIVKFSEVIQALQDYAVEAKDKNTLLKEIINQIDYDCEDLGRQKGCKLRLEIFLK